MTRLTKPVTRVIPDVWRRGTIVVTLTRHGIEFRYPRRRKTSQVFIGYGLAMLKAEQLCLGSRDK